MRRALSLTVDVLGVACLAGAGWLVAPAIGLAVLGLGLLALAYLLEAP